MQPDDGLNDHWDDESSRKYTDWPSILLGLAIAVAACGMLVFSCSARAHDYARPELKQWFMGLKNSNGSPCCDGDDAVHIEDADWDTSCDGGTCHYRVRLEGKWYDVPPHAVVDAPNRAGTALVWPIRYGFPPGSGKDADYVIRCFMPGTQI